jgi:hypothetical protein
MKFVKPTLFAEAVQKLGDKSTIGSKLSSAEWGEMPVALRERGYFISRLENARVLQRSKDSLNEFLVGARETLPNGATALKTGGRAQFVDQMEKFMAKEGIGRTTGDVRDHTSESRQSLVFNTQTQQAQDYGNWKQGQDPDVLNEFPAQRFIREHAVRVPRRYHQLNVGRVELKSNLKFWLSMNPDFNVPWGPWGFNSGMGVEDVDRDESDRMGLTHPDQKIEPVEKKFNDDLQASTQGLDPEMIEKLKAQFGDQVTFEGDTAKWVEKQNIQHPTPNIEHPTKSAAPTQIPDAIPQTRLDTPAKVLHQVAFAKIDAEDAVQQLIALGLTEVEARARVGAVLPPQNPDSRP